MYLATLLPSMDIESVPKIPVQKGMSLRAHCDPAWRAIVGLDQSNGIAGGSSTTHIH